MRQYVITSQNSVELADDCLLSPDDPIHDMIATEYMGGLNATSRIGNRRQEAILAEQAERDKAADEAKALGYKPGSPAYYAFLGTTTTRSRKKK